LLDESVLFSSQGEGELGIGSCAQQHIGCAVVLAAGDERLRLRDLLVCELDMELRGRLGVGADFSCAARRRFRIGHWLLGLGDGRPTCACERRRREGKNELFWHDDLSVDGFLAPMCATVMVATLSGAFAGNIE
jgi:hypothetical protein